MIRKTVLVLILLIVIVSSVCAEYRRERGYDPYTSSFFVALHGGGFIPQDIYSIHTDMIIYNQPAWFENSATFDSSFMFGGGIGFFLTDNVGIRFDIDHVSVDAVSDFTLNVANPLNPATTIQLSTSVDGLSVNWTSFSANLIFRFKLSNSFMFTLGGGMTYWMADIYVPESYSWGLEGITPVFAAIDFEVYETNFLGFNGLLMMEYFLDRGISISFEGRYLLATDEVTVDDLISTDPVEVTLGGIYAAVGLNLYI